MHLHWLIPTITAIVIGVGLFADIVFHDTKKPVALTAAIGWSLFWVALSLGFAGWLYGRYGSAYAGLFLSGYLMEKALSVDNLMAFAAIFVSFRIPAIFQHKLLHYGIIGAILSRLVFTIVGTGSLILFGPYVAAIFGLIVLWSAYKMLGSSPGGDAGEAVDYSQEWYVQWLARYFPIWRSASPNFFVPAVTGTFITPLFICLIAIEISDILFSFDSVPAVISIVQEPTLVYAAMLFAIMGLRSLYFVVSALMRYFTQLPKAIILILVFVGLKMLIGAASTIFHLGLPQVTPVWNFAIIISMLALGVGASLIFNERNVEE